MSKSQLSKEQKIKIVKDFLSKTETTTAVDYARIHSIRYNSLLQWVRAYKIRGENAFDEGRGKNYPEELKEAAMHEYITTDITAEELCLKYNICSTSSIYEWTGRYNEKYDTKIHLFVKSKRTMRRLKIVQEYLISKTDTYETIAKNNNIAASTLWRWVNLYNKFGTDGLADRRMFKE